MAAIAEEEDALSLEAALCEVMDMGNDSASDAGEAELEMRRNCSPRRIGSMSSRPTWKR